MAEKMTHDELAYQHALGHYELLHPEALGYVNLTLKRMIARGLLAQEQINEDLVQEASLAAMEACRTWQPFISTLGSWVENWVRGISTNYLIAQSTGMIGGRRSGYVVLSESTPLEQVEPDDPATIADSVSYTPVRRKHAPHGEDAPEGLGDPMDEAARQQEQELARKLVATLSPDDRDLVRSLFGIGQPQELLLEYCRRVGEPYRSAKRRWADIRRKLALRA